MRFLKAVKTIFLLALELARRFQTGNAVLRCRERRSPVAEQRLTNSQKLKFPHLGVIRESAVNILQKRLAPAAYMMPLTLPRISPSSLAWLLVPSGEAQ